MADEIHTEPIQHEKRPSVDDSSPNYLNGNDSIEDDANENSLDPLLVDEESSNIDSSPEIDYQEKPVELKAQRALDEDEIPPPVVPTEQTPIELETTHSSTESESNITDDRPLTELETPYEHHEENETSPAELSNDQSSSNNHSFVEIEQSPEFVETEQEQEEEQEEEEEVEVEEEEEVEVEEEEEVEVEEEDNVQEEAHFTEEDFPPLPSPAVPTDQIKEEQQQPLATTIFKEEEFPPLPVPEATTIVQTNEEIISLPEPEDILGNKTLIKQIIEQGTPSTRPTRSTLATVTYTLSLIDNFTSNVRVIETVSHESFFVSECDTIPAVDLAVQFMNRGERAIIDADIRHGYGELGYEEKQIPSINSTTNQSYRMKIDLELHDWKSPPNIQSLTVDERLFWGDKKRQMGNFYYRRRDYSNALQCYRGALRFLDTETNPLGVSCDNNQRSLLTDSYIQVQNNVAQVNLFLNKYDACLNAVENVLKYDPKNVKALFRQGKALFELGRYDQALQPLKSFAQIQRGNSSAAGDYDKVTEMITTCENKLANYQKNEKEIYRRMFQPAPTTPATTNQQRQTKVNKKTDNASSNTWLYIGLGGAALAAIGIFTFMKYRKTS